MLAYSRARLAALRHRLFPMTGPRLIGLFVFTLAGLLFLGADYLFFSVLFRNLLANEAIPHLLLVGLCAKLMGLVLLTTFTMLLFSAAVSALSYLFLDDDLTLLLPLPAPRWKLRTLRALQAATNAGYMVFLLLVPVLLAYLTRFRPSAWAYLAGLAGLLLYLSVPLAWGVAATTLLARFFPARRLHQLLTVASLVLVCLLVVLLRLSRPEALLNPRSSHQAAEVLSSIALPREALLPSTWLAELVTRGAEGTPAETAPPLARLALLSALSVSFAGLGLSRWHAKAYARAQERQDVLPGAPPTRVLPLLARLFSRAMPAPAPARALLRRDFLLFARDPAQWGQLFILAALVVIYLANVRYMPAEVEEFKIAVAFWNLATLGLIVASVAGRFAFTAVGGEGGAYFSSRTLPLTAGLYLWAKFLFTAVPLTALSCAALYLSNRFLGVSGAALAFMLFLAVAASLTLSALALAAGAIQPTFDSKNPGKAVMSAWGLVYMVVSMGYVAALLVASARPVYRYYRQLLSGGGPPDFTGPALAFGLLSAALILVAMGLAHFRLRRLQPRLG